MKKASPNKTEKIINQLEEIYQVVYHLEVAYQTYQVSQVYKKKKKKKISKDKKT